MLQSLKYGVKRGLQHIAARVGRHTRSLEIPQLLILMYHRILPIDDPRSQSEEPGMMVTPETFRMHLEVIKEHFNIVHLSHWLDYKQTDNHLEGNYCAITFDDGWADNYEYAYRTLKQFDIPATIFVVSELVGTNRLFWPERLAQLITTIAETTPEYWSSPDLSWLTDLPVSYGFNTQKPSQDQLSEIIAQLKNLNDVDIHKKIDQVATTLHHATTTHTPDLLNWDQITDMVSSGIIEIGSHTCRHIRLNKQIAPDQLIYEIAMSKQQIENHIGIPVKHFCFPNGDYTPEALTQVQSLYKGAVTTLTGWNTMDTDCYQLRRIAIHEDITKDKTAFLARISGWI